MSTPTIVTQAYNVPLTVSGTTNGFVTIGTTYVTLFNVGMTVFIGDNTALINSQAVVTDVDYAGGKLGLRMVREERTRIGPDANGAYTYGGVLPQSLGRSDCSAYLTANTAYVLLPKQINFSGNSDDAAKSAPLNT